MSYGLPTRTEYAAGKGIKQEHAEKWHDSIAADHTSIENLASSSVFQQYGGDGTTDGDLNITIDRTETVDDAGREYGSVTIAAGCTLTFQPTGNAKIAKVGIHTLTATATSKIAGTAEGFPGGAGGAATANGTDGSGSARLNPGGATGGGGGGSGTGSATGGDGGPGIGTQADGGATTGDNGDDGADAIVLPQLQPANVGAGTGGGGGAGANGGGLAGGAGGAGGAGLILEIRTATMPTGFTIESNGEDGANGAGPSGGYSAGGGGGGGAGDVYVAVKTGDDGAGGSADPTLSATGGTGGTGPTGTGNAGDGGDGGDGRTRFVDMTV